MSVENPRFPHTCTITRKGETDPMSDEDAEGTVIYEGPCRGYEKNTTSIKGEVITTNRGLSLPVNRREWMERGMVPCEGDELSIDFGPYQEHGMLIDRMTANFHGSHFIWKHVKD